MNTKTITTVLALLTLAICQTQAAPDPTALEPAQQERITAAIAQYDRTHKAPPTPAQRLTGDNETPEARMDRMAKLSGIR